MKQTIKHNGFLGSVEASFEDNCLHGEILFINDKITYEGANPEELEQEFIKAVEDYIDVCNEIGRAPNKPFSGSFNVRIPIPLHEQAAKKAHICDVSLNEFVRIAISEKVALISNKTVHLLHHHEHRLEVTFPGSRTQFIAGEETKWQPEVKTSITLQ